MKRDQEELIRQLDEQKQTQKTLEETLTMQQAAAVSAAEGEENPEAREAQLAIIQQSELLKQQLVLQQEQIELQKQEYEERKIRDREVERLTHQKKKKKKKKYSALI
eukprot:Platyproteum_vivax@DN15598_c0_g1_i1.p1